MPLTAARLLDTRAGGVTVDGVASGGGVVTAGGQRSFPVAGRGGLPVTGVGAVVLNVTGAGPSAATYLTVFPSGEALPLASSLNLKAGQTAANLVVVKAPTSGPALGAVSVYNSTGSTQVIVDLAGYYPVGASFTPLSPARLLDTRPGFPTVDGQFSGRGPVGPGGVLNVTVTGRDGIPATGVAAVILNLTGTGATAATYVAQYPTGQPRPNASTLNLAAGATSANLAVVKVGAGGQVSLANAAGFLNLIADVAGWVPSGTSYTPITPARFLDTRPGGSTIDGIDAGGGPVGYGQSIDVAVAGRAGIPATAVAVVVNLTVAGGTAGTCITAYPAGSAIPNASNLNVVAGEVRANLAVVKLGTAGRVTLTNAAGQTPLIADVVGWFDAAPATTWATLTAGYRHTCGVSTDGTAWCWGSNSSGQLGNGTPFDSAFPVQVGTAATWATLAAGDHHTCGVRTDGTAWCWGANNTGQLGIGSTTTSTVPVQVGTATTWAHLSAGQDHTCGVRTDGSAWCWGFNPDGELGNGSTADSAVPVQVGTTTTWVTLSVGAFHTCGVRTDGTAWCWGSNSTQQLGDGSVTDSAVPVRVTTSATSSWATLTAGSFHTCGVRTDGTAWCWGYNSYGQFGDGSLVSSGIPVQVGTATTWATLAAADHHTCGVRTDTTAWCWGTNDNGELGNGTTSTTLVPVQVS